jgi:hypothetical protein
MQQQCSFSSLIKFVTVHWFISVATFFSHTTSILWPPMKHRDATFSRIIYWFGCLLFLTAELMAGAPVTPVSQANIAIFKRPVSDNSKLIEQHQSFPYHTSTLCPHG